MLCYVNILYSLNSKMLYSLKSADVICNGVNILYSLKSADVICSGVNILYSLNSKILYSLKSAC
jgi:hypothetical protein